MIEPLQLSLFFPFAHSTQSPHTHPQEIPSPLFMSVGHGACAPLTCSHLCVSMCVCVFFIEHFLISDTIRWSMLIIHISFPSSRINCFCEEHISFIGGCISNQSVSVSSVCCYWSVISFSPVSWENTEMCVCTKPCTCIYV